MSFLERNNFLIRKLHSLSGIIPIGLFLLEHLITNSFAMQGAASFDEKIAALQSFPYLTLIEIVFIAIPLIFHTVFGLYFVYLARNNVLDYKYFRNWMFYLQRATALIAFVYVVYHVYTTRIAKAFSGVDITYQFMHDILTQPLFFAIYLIGLLAAIFHFSNGLWTLFISWGITIGPKSQKVFQIVCIILFVILSAVGTAGLIALAA